MKKGEKLDSGFWEERWQSQLTQWDIGFASPPLVRYIDRLVDKTARILIPGAGSAYEAIYLHKKGFQNVFVCDWASSSFSHLKAVCPDFPKEHLITGDFFNLDLSVDLLIEQTFFCAIAPEIRTDYVNKAYDLIKTGGLLAGLLFSIEFPFKGPPFGGNIKMYEKLFSPSFDIIKMEIEENSIPSRSGNELFIEMKKR